MSHPCDREPHCPLVFSPPQLDAPAENKHTIFVNSKDGAEQLCLAEHFDTPAELASRSKHRPRNSAPAETAADSRGWGDAPAPVSSWVPGAAPSGVTLSGKAGKKAKKAQAARYSELTQREARHHKMSVALERIGLEKALQGKGRVKKLKTKPNEPRKFKWRQERKR